MTPVVRLLVKSFSQPRAFGQTRFGAPVSTHARLAPIRCGGQKRRRSIAGPLEPSSFLLGHTKIESTVRYLGSRRCACCNSRTDRGLNYRAELTISAQRDFSTLSHFVADFSMNQLTLPQNRKQ